MQPEPFPAELRAADNEWAAASRDWQTYRGLICMNLALRSLPAGFASESGAAVLDPLSFADPEAPLPPAPKGHHRAMVGDAFWRCIDTFQFIDQMLDTPSSPRHDLAKAKRLRDLRDQHDWIGAKLADSQIGDVLRGMGRAPMDGFQMVGSACSFVVPVADGFGLLSLGTEGEPDWDAWTSVWFEIAAWQSGQTAHWLEEHGHATVKTIAGARRLEDLIYEIEPPSRTLGGVRLMRNLYADIYDALPRPVRPLLLVGLTYVGDEWVNHLLLVNESRFGRWLRKHRQSGPRWVRRLTWRLSDRFIRRFVDRFVARAKTNLLAEPLLHTERFARGASSEPITIDVEQHEARDKAWSWPESSGYPPEQLDLRPDSEPERTSS